MSTIGLTHGKLPININLLILNLKWDEYGIPAEIVAPDAITSLAPTQDFLKNFYTNYSHYS